MLRNIMLVVVLSSVATNVNAGECTDSLAPHSPITVVGAYSNMRFTTEHAYGYTVELWRAKECYFGLFFSSSGLMGDTPTGLLENMKYDKNAGAISFDARLTMGTISPVPGDNVWVPTKDVYEFSGILKNKVLAGDVSHRILNMPAARPKLESVVLNSSPDNLSYLADYSTYAQWKNSTNDILKFRGPKW